MSCKFYESNPGRYGSCSAKREKARIEENRGSQRESDGYIDYDESRAYECDSGSSRKDNCPYRNNSSSGSGCFVTTACINAKNLPDDCYELETLRKFRDTYVKLQPSGKADIALYYEHAPIIAKKISELPNGNQIFCDLYQELVLPCVEFIEKGEYSKAYDLYLSTTLQLKGEYANA